MVLRKGSKPVSITHQHLMGEWDFEKNGEVRPEDFSFGSAKKVWWKCSVCGYLWKTNIFNRSCHNKGCPSCAGNVVSGSNRLSALYSHICEEWCFEDNKDLFPDEVSYGSTKKVWWKCKKCGHRWVASVCNRTLRKSKCPACYGRVVTDENNLFVNFPHLMKEWDYLKNSIDPKKILPGYRKKTWWVCSCCGFSWETVPYVRTRDTGGGCPRCAKGTSSISQKWLDYLNIPQEFREYRIRGLGGPLGLFVDGFDPETNTVYEFLGDYWHGNPKVYHLKDINPTIGKPFGELYEETMERISLLKENNYNVVYIWESEYNV